MGILLIPIADVYRKEKNNEYIYSAFLTRNV